MERNTKLAMNLLAAAKNSLAAEDAHTAAVSRRELESAVTAIEAALPIRKLSLERERDRSELPKYVVNLYLACNSLVRGLEADGEAIEAIRITLDEIDNLLPEVSDAPRREIPIPPTKPDGLAMQAALELIRARIAFDAALVRWKHFFGDGESPQEPHSHAGCEAIAASAT